MDLKSLCRFLDENGYVYEIVNGNMIVIEFPNTKLGYNDLFLIYFFKDMVTFSLVNGLSLGKELTPLLMALFVKWNTDFKMFKIVPYKNNNGNYYIDIHLDVFNRYVAEITVPKFINMSNFILQQVLEEYISTKEED